MVDYNIDNYDYLLHAFFGHFCAKLKSTLSVSHRSKNVQLPVQRGEPPDRAGTVRLIGSVIMAGSDLGSKLFMSRPGVVSFIVQQLVVCRWRRLRMR